MIAARHTRVFWQYKGRQVSQESLPMEGRGYNQLLIPHRNHGGEWVEAREGREGAANSPPSPPPPNVHTVPSACRKCSQYPCTRLDSWTPTLA